MVKSNPLTIADCFRLSGRQFGQVLGRIWLWLAFATFMDQVFEFITHWLGEKSERFAMGYIFVYIGLHFAITSVTVIVVNQAYWDADQGTQGEPLYDRFRKYFKYILIESARVAAWIMLGLLLFVIPALIWSVRLFWVLYIVQFDPAYEKGEIDALERSRQLTKGFFFWSVGILVLSTLIDWPTEIFLSTLNPLATPSTYFFAFVLTIFASLYSSGVLFYAYFLLVGKKGEIDHGNSLSSVPATGT